MMNWIKGVPEKNQLLLLYAFFIGISFFVIGALLQLNRYNFGIIFMMLGLLYFIYYITQIQYFRLKALIKNKNAFE